jgi:Putative MetA-pathway of phenol degradation
MIPSRSTANTETDSVSSIRTTRVAGRLPCALALSALTLTGCMTTSEHAQTNRAASPAASAAVRSIIPPDASSVEKPIVLVRLQSPAADDGGAVATPAQSAQPPLPDPSVSSSAPDTSPALDTPPSVDPAVAAVPSPAVRTADNGASSAARGLSSIARNRRANRGVPNPMPSAGGDPGSSDLNPRLRDRLKDSVAPGAEPEFNYPDIHADPAKIYHDRFGVEEEHDPFVFPWLMNLIFEDRWLLAEKDPTEALRNQLRRRTKIDIRDPDPDTANFPNGAYTLAKGRMYIENSPLGLYGASKNSPRVYQWEYLLRYGLTDNLELRIFSNGYTAQASQGKQKATTGNSPLAFDFKINFWEENLKYHIPAMGVEIYIQTPFGSPAFNAGTQPSINLLFDQSLPLGVGFEYNFGIAGVQNGLGLTKYQFNFAWSFQREVVKDFDIFVHGYYNESGLPRTIQFRHVKDLATLEAQAAIPAVNVVGVGAIKTVNDRFAIFGSYNFGTTSGSPHTIALTGFAVAF